MENPQEKQQRKPHENIEFGAAKFLVNLKVFLKEYGDIMPEDFKEQVLALGEEIKKRWNFSGELK